MKLAYYSSCVSLTIYINYIYNIYNLYIYNINYIYIYSRVGTHMI